MITLLFAVITKEVGIADDRWVLVTLALDLLVEAVGIVLIIRELL